MTGSPDIQAPDTRIVGFPSPACLPAGRDTLDHRMPIV